MKADTGALLQDKKKDDSLHPTSKMGQMLQNAKHVRLTDIVFSATNKFVGIMTDDLLVVYNIQAGTSINQVSESESLKDPCETIQLNNNAYDRIIKVFLDEENIEDSWVVL